MLKIRRKFVRHSHQILYFLLVLLAFTSANIILYKFLELHSTLSEKEIFNTNFSFLTDSPQPPQPLNGQNLLSMAKVFRQCSLTCATKKSDCVPDIVRCYIAAIALMLGFVLLGTFLVQFFECFHYEQKMIYSFLEKY